MSQIEWAMWANEQAVTTSAILLLGGVLGVAGMFNLWQFGAYGLGIGVLIAALEWPRSKRKKGNTVLRHCQRPFAILVNKLGVLGRNYFVRFVAYLLLCVPCYFTLSTLMGGICLLLTGVIYLVAAVKGEEWTPAGLEDPNKAANEKQIKSLEPPKKPPPRPQQANRIDGDVQTEEITMEIVEERPSAVPQRPATGPKKPAQSTETSKPSRPPPRPRAAAAQGIQESDS